MPLSGIEVLQSHKVAIQQMVVFKARIADLADGLLAQVVREQFEMACQGRVPWSYYHLARDEQINRVIANVGAR